MGSMVKLVVFHSAEQQFALHLNNLERVINSVEISPLPMAPPHVAGTVNFHGEYLPVINIRKLFNLPLREVELSDRFLIVSSAIMSMILWVDSVDEIVEIPADQIEEAKNVLVDSGYVEGIFKLREGLVLINDLDRFLTSEQVARLAEEFAKQESQILE